MFNFIDEKLYVNYWAWMMFSIFWVALMADTVWSLSSPRVFELPILVLPGLR